jgi:hypothetical protein
MRERIDADLRDSLDEELELELEDREIEAFRTTPFSQDRPPAMDRSVYFKELFRLQGELVKLQDWSGSRWSSSSRAATPPARAA